MTVLRNPETVKEVALNTNSKSKLNFILDAKKFQVILGSLWILDAFLQMQPKMFGTSFISMVISPNADDQPSLIHHVISSMSSFLSSNVAFWNTLFVIIQFLIGLGILFNKTFKTSVIASIFWAGGVWCFGEGFGGIFRGDANPLMGAPGAVILYPLIGLLIWPKGKTNNSPRTGDDTLLGITGAIFLWAGLWIFFGLLQLLPQNRTSSWASDLVSGMASGEPSWYHQILLHIGSSLNGIGTLLAIIMAALFFLIGLGPIFSGRPSIFFKLAIGISVVFWLTGEAMGQIFTGMGTDPNQGPLLVIIAICVMPLANVYADRAALNPLKLNGRSYLTTLGLVSLATVPALIAVFPTAQSQAANKAHVYDSSSMAGMTMTSSGTSSGSSNSNKSAHVMNMAGMAGLNVVDPNWKYTGPPLPASEIALLNYVSSIEDKGHKMQTPNCMTPPTATQVLQATQYVQATSQGVAKYKNLSTAIADGYFPITDTRYPIVHYLNFKYMSTKYIFDPNHVDSLVYAFTPYGPVLVAAMYLMPRQGNGPMPFGCLVQWHAHSNLCFSLTTYQISGFLPCPPGTVYEGVTPMMTHVWQVPVPGGPLAIDPSDLQVIEAAIMAQQEGLAPSNGPIP